MFSARLRRRAGPLGDPSVASSLEIERANVMC